MPLELYSSDGNHVFELLYCICRQSESHLLIAIPLGTCEKAKPVNTGSQKHVSYLLNVEKKSKIQPLT